MQNILSKTIAALLFASASSVAVGATYEWTGPGGTANFPFTGNWSDPTSWAGGFPLSGGSTTLSFGGSGNYFSIDDLTDTFQLNALKLTPSGPITLQGGPLELVSNAGSAPQIQFSSGAQLSLWNPITNNSALTIGGGGTGLLLIGQASSFTDGLISGTGSVTIDLPANGLVGLFAASTYTGDTTLVRGKLAFGRSSDGAPGSFTSGPVGTGTLHLNGGIIRASSAGSFSLSNAVTVGGNITLGDAAVAPVQNSLTFDGPVTLTGTNATRVLTLNAPNATDTMGIFNGAIGDSGGKNGITINGVGQTGTLIFSGANTYGGITTLNAGNLIITGSTATTGATIVNGGKLQATTSAGTPLGTGAVTLNSGTLEFAPDVSASTSTGSIALNGGLLSIAPAGFNDVVDVKAANLPGSTFSYSGYGVVSVSRGFNAGLRFILGAPGAASNSVLSRADKAALILRFSDTAETNIGVVEKVIVNGGVAMKNGIVSPTIIGQRAGDNFGVFLGYDAVNGFVRASEVSRSGAFTANAGEITTVNANATANPSNPYALRVDNFTLTIASGNTVTVGDGTGQAGIIMNPVGADSKITGGTLAFGAAEGVIYAGGTTAFARLESAVTGSGGVTKVGPGNLVIQGPSTFTGGFVIKDGGVVFAGTEILNGGVITSSPVGTGTLTFAGGGMRTTSGGDRTISNPVNIAGRATFPTGSSGKALTFAGPITLSGADNTLVVDAAGALNFIGVVGEDTPGRNLIKSGGTTLTLGGGAADAAPNTYTGTTTVTAGTLLLNKQAGTDAFRGDLVLSGGTVQLAQANQIADSSKVTINSGVLKLQTNAAGGAGSAETLGQVTINGGQLQTNPSGLGSNTVAANTVTMTGGTFAINSGATVNVSKLVMSGGTTSMSGNGVPSRFEIGSGGLQLSTTPNTTPSFDMAPGASGTRLRLSGDVTFDGSTNPNQVNIGQGTQAGDIAPLIELNGTRTFTVNDGAAVLDLAVGPVLVDGPSAGALIKTGNGTLSINRGGSYTGGTTVNAGTLVVNGALSGNVTVNGGILRGSGILNAVSIGSNGTLAAGTPTQPGVLTADALTLAGNSILSLRIDMLGNDQVAANSVTLGGVDQVKLDLVLTYDPSDEGFETFKLVDNMGVAVTTGRLKYGNTVLGEGAVFTVTNSLFSQAFRISYLGDTGNDVVLTAVPEPCSAALLLGGFGTMIGLRRFRRSTRA